MTVVVGTAGHIDHGKTTLLRTLTGIDADRLPEERRRGMTIDVGYAHMTLPDGDELDFVDVPGHDRLVGNMLVGAGEIDAVVLVVAADDGPRPQTLEHLALLDGLGIRHGIVAVTKADVVDAHRLRAIDVAVTRLLVGTSLAGSPLVAVSAVSGSSLDALRDALIDLRDRVLVGAVRGDGRPPRLAIDRVFAVKGRGVVVTGTLRGGSVDRGTILRVVPGGTSVRVREIQVHGRALDRVTGGGRAAFNLAGAGAGSGALRRGAVLTTDPDVIESDRILAVLARGLPDRLRARLHIGTDAVDVAAGRGRRDRVALPDGRTAAILRLARPIAVGAGDRFVLRLAAGLPMVVGGIVLDPRPPRGVSRRRQTPERIAPLLDDPGARLELHGAVATGSRVQLATDVRVVGVAAATDAVRAGTVGIAALRTIVAAALRRTVSLAAASAAVAARDIVEQLIADGVLRRDGDAVRLPGAVVPTVDPAVAAAMDRLVASLDMPAPPPLAQAAQAAGCSLDALRGLERDGRIVVVAPDLAYAASRYEALAAVALTLASRAPLTPAAFRDATGTSRKYVMAILEDLDRRAVLRRTSAGHVPGPRSAAGARA